MSLSPPARAISTMRRTLSWIGRGLAAALLLALFWQMVLLTQVIWWSRFDPGSTSFMRMRLAELRQTDPEARLRHQWVPYERISIHLKRAVVAAEDDKFIDHEGFDWEGMQKAIEKNRRKGRVVAGGSTISQQLAKNLLLSPSKSILRKGGEATVTVWLELLWGKRRILEVYLNTVEWGEGIFGAEAAARHYFGVSASQLSPAQAARLAVMLPAPRRFGKNPYSPYLNRRTEIILARMRYAAIPR